ncbi:hypothetical protein GC175_19105 [bacterium]|nr:hypothetical protein [bacterium]
MENRQWKIVNGKPLMLSIPEEFVYNTVAREGKAGQLWIAQLPELFDAFCRRWDLVLDGEVLHGYLGLVVPVLREDERCVLKLSWRNASLTQEMQALKTWAGNGAALLLEADPAQGALLLERLAPRSLGTVPVDEAIVIAGRLLRRLAIPAPSEVQSQTEVASEMVTLLPARWTQFCRPFPRRVLEAVLETVQSVTACEDDLLVNYDLHYENVLAGEREPWLVIDPKVVRGDPVFGLAQLLWTRLEEIEDGPGVESIFSLLVESAQVDSVHARAWTMVRIVDYWLWALSVGFTYDPARCRILVDRLFPNH